MTDLISITKNSMCCAEAFTQEEITEKVLFLPDLFEKMLNGKATEIEMNAMVILYSKYGIAVLNLVKEHMLKVPKTKAYQENSLGPTVWKRYGSKDKPIFSYPIAGELGEQGAVLIAAHQGETCDISQFDSYIGPLHYHDDVVHITAVTQGRGIFLIAGEVEQKKYLVKVQVKPGSIVFIPANVIHTFFVSSSTFEVVSFTTRLIPTDSPEFLTLANFDELKTRPFIDYHEFLKKKNSPVVF